MTICLESSAALMTNTENYKQEITANKVLKKNKSNNAF